MQPLAWDDFRLIRAIADQRSLAGAAEALTVNNSTVFRRLNGLEEQLGVRIFERSRSGYILTPAGEEMFRLAVRMADSILEFERRIAGQDVRPSGELRVTSTDTMFSDLVAPIFSAFRSRYPEIMLDFVIDNRPLNLSRRDADVAIRASAEPPQTLVGRRVGTIVWSAYASRDYLTETGQDEGPNTEGLLQNGMRWIGIGEPLQTTAAARWITNNVPPSNVVVKVNSVSAMAAATEAGLGIGMMPCFMGATRPNLVRVPIDPGSNAGLWVLTHPDLKKAARVRAFLDFFGSELAKKRRLLEGEEG